MLIDDKKIALSTLTGLSKSIPDMELQWLRTNTGNSEFSIPQLWYIYLTTLGYSGSIPDMKVKYFQSLGYSGDLPTMEAAFWASASPLWTLFRNGEDGFLFGNWSELDELFTTSTGTTAVAANNDPVGLALDDRAWGARTLAQQLAQETEIVSAAWVNGSVNNFDVFSASGAGFSGSTSTAKIGGAVINSPVTVTTEDLFRVEIQVNAASKAHTFAFVNGATGAATQRSNPVTIPLTASPVAVVGYVKPTTNGDLYPQINNGGSFISSVDIASVSIKEIPGNHALQSTTTQRPLWRANSGKPYLSFDGSDDNLLSRYVPGPVGCLAFAGVCSGNSRMALGGELSPGRLYFGLNAAGALGAGVGSNSYVIHSDNVSRSGVTGVGLLTYDGSTVRLYWDGALIYSGAQSGAVGATPIRLGAGGATPNFFWSGAIYAALAMNRVPSAPEIALITRQFQRTYQ